MCQPCSAPPALCLRKLEPVQESHLPQPPPGPVHASPRILCMPACARRWLLGAEGCCPWTFAAPAAALRAGHAVLGEWLMRRRPCGAGTGSGVPSCASLTSLSLSSSTPSPSLPAPAAACSNSGGGGGRDCGNSGGGGGRDCGNSGGGGGAGGDGDDDGPAPQRPGQVLGGRRTWLDGVMAAAARGCGLQQLVGLHERWLDRWVGGSGREVEVRGWR